MRLPSLPLLALFGLMTACGQQAPVAPPRHAAMAMVTPPPAAPQGTDAATAARVVAAIARLDKVQTLTGTVVFDEWKNEETDHGKAMFTFRHSPFAARVDVLDSSRLLATGGVMLWEGEKSLRIKPLKMPFSLSFAYDNSQVVSLRGYRIDQTDIFSMGKVLRAPGAQIQPLGPRRVRGEDVFLLDVHSPASLKDVTREVIGLNEHLLIPTYREMYAGDKLIHRGQGLGVVLDKPVASSRFDL